MRNIFKLILGFFEYISLFLVGYYGMKYTLVAGPIFFGNPAGTIVAYFVILMFVIYILKKEGVIKR